MSFQRDITWQNIEADYRSSISHKLARYALSLNFEMLPENVVHQAKRCLLDALGCAIGAYDSPGRPICEDTVEELGGAPHATVFGSGLKTNVLNATLVNSFMVRYLDYSDVGGGGHNSDAISALIAVAEKEKSNGKDFLAALVISYELGHRFLIALSKDDLHAGFSNLAKRGWCTDIRGGLTMPPALGKLMGLSEEQIANAVGATACHSFPMNLLDANDEEYVMSKNLRFGWVAYNAVLASMMARRGFTGPRRVVEGDAGFNHTIMLNQMNLSAFDDFSQWHIMETYFKTICTNFTTQAQILATIELVKEHDIKPEDVEHVEVKVCQREADHTTAPAKKYPRNGESADHSSYFGNALAIIERDFGPESFKEEKFTDPRVLDLIERISVTVDPEEPHLSFAGTSKITTKAGQTYEKKISVPAGFTPGSLTDQQLEDKFRAMAVKVMPEQQVSDLLECIWNVEQLDDFGRLTALMQRS